MRPIVYLAGYPRSGNTFLRALLANYHSDLPRPATRREVAAFTVGEHDEALLTRCTGLPADERSIEDQWNARHAYLNHLRRTPGDGPVLLRTHSFNGSVFGLPAFDFAADDRIVYLIRNPLDVAVSGAQSLGIDQAHMAARMLLPGATSHRQGRHETGAYYEVTGSWSEHVTSWLNEARIPVHLMRFETLCSNAGQELARLLSFIGEPVQRDRVQQAARRTAVRSPDIPAANDSPHAHAGHGRRSTAPRGRAGLWKRALSGNVAAHLSGELGGLMDRLGYERAPGFSVRTFGRNQSG